MYYGKDETGKRYSRLTVMAFDDNNIRPTNHWLCTCNCGNVVSIGGRELRYGRTKSCGCLNDEKRRERVGIMGQTTAAWRLPMGTATFRIIYRQYISSAKHRNISWDMLEGDVHKLMQQNCFYCGAEPNNVVGTALYNGTFKYNGLDRVDNSRGYILDNVVPCCETCNKAKLDLPIEDFIAWLFRASEYLKENIHALKPGSQR